MPFNPGLIQAFSQMPSISRSESSRGSARDVMAYAQMLDQRKESEAREQRLRQDMEFDQQMRVSAMSLQDQQRKEKMVQDLMPAIYSGNRVDAMRAAQQLRAAGIDVKMPDSYLKLPPEPEQPQAPAPPAAPSPEMKALEGIEKKATGELAGLPPTELPPMPSIAQPEPPQQMQMAQAPTPQPGGPAMGPGAMGVPAQDDSWVISVGGREIRIAPEEVAAYQEAEVDEAFAPLHTIAQETGDQVAARAYQLGHEHASGLIGLVSPKEAVAAGQDIAQQYMNHWYKGEQLRTGGGKRPGGGATGPSLKERRFELSEKRAEFGEYNKVEEVSRQRIKTVYNHENYKQVAKDLGQARQAMSRLDTNTPLGEYVAFRQQMRQVEDRLSNADAEYYSRSGGMFRRIREHLDYMIGQGHLDPQRISEIKTLLQQALSGYEKKAKVTRDEALGSAREYLRGLRDQGLITDEEYERQVNNARSLVGLGRVRLKKRKSPEGTVGSSADEEAKGLL